MLDIIFKRKMFLKKILDKNFGLFGLNQEPQCDHQKAASNPAVNQPPDGAPDF